MEIFGSVPGHVDRLFLLAPPFTGSLGSVVGPYFVEACQVYIGGAMDSRVYLTGADQFQAFLAGSQSSQVAVGSGEP